MSTPNPLNPQGSLLEQKSKRKTNLPIIVAIFVAAHLIGAAGILMVGCKQEPKPEAKKAPEPVLPPITPPPDAPPVSPAPGTAGGPGTLPPIGGTSGLAPAPLPTTPPTPTPTPVAPPTPVPSTPPPIAVAPITPPPPVTPPAEPPPAAPTGEAKVHVVAKGDSFSTMAKKYGVGVKAIEAANAGVDSAKLKIGQKINIPAAAPKAPKAPTTTGGAPAPADADGSYTVKSGDNLGKIAKSHGTTVAKLREANGLKTDQIKVGQKLKMPTGSSSPKKSSEPSASAVPAPKSDAVPVLPPTLPPLGEPVSAPAPKL